MFCRKHRNLERRLNNSTAFHLPLRHEVGERVGERWCSGNRGRSSFVRDSQHPKSCAETFLPPCPRESFSSCANASSILFAFNLHLTLSIKSQPSDGLLFAGR